MEHYNISIQLTEMWLPQQTMKLLPSHLDHLAIGESPRILRQILQPEIGLVLWQRGATPHLLRELAGLNMAGLKDVRFSARLDTLAEQLPAQMWSAGYPDMPALRAHMLYAVEQLLAAVHAHAVSVRLETIDGDACRRFHADYVMLRGLTTYAGPGTQWIPSDLGTDPDAADIWEIDRFALAVLKGRLWADEPAILHRSPPISGTGQRRLLLVIDPVGLREHAAPIPFSTATLVRTA